MDSTIIRCRKCGKRSRVALKDIDSRLRCGHCRENLTILDAPLNIGEASFEGEVLRESGLVCLVFSADT